MEASPFSDPLVIATGNPHKVEEFAELLGDLESGARLVSAAAMGVEMSVEETAVDFAGNARLKARFVRDSLQGKHGVLADDSGLEVAALGGRPGVYSARYAGDEATDGDNIDKLLSELKPFPRPETRRASFVCVLCWIDADGKERVFEGRSAGRIAAAPSGSGGFGYDPVFIPDGYAVSFADLPPSVKAGCSHRARAAARLRPKGSVHESLQNR